MPIISWVYTSVADYFTVFTNPMAVTVLSVIFSFSFNLLCNKTFRSTCIECSKITLGYINKEAKARAGGPDFF